MSDEDKETILSTLWREAARAQEKHVYYLQSGNQAEIEVARKAADKATKAAEVFEYELTRG